MISFLHETERPRSLMDGYESLSAFLVYFLGILSVYLEAFRILLPVIFTTFGATVASVLSRFRES